MHGTVHLHDAPLPAARKLGRATTPWDGLSPFPKKTTEQAGYKEVEG